MLRPICNNCKRFELCPLYTIKGETVGKCWWKDLEGKAYVKYIVAPFDSCPNFDCRYLRKELSYPKTIEDLIRRFVPITSPGDSFLIATRQERIAPAVLEEMREQDFESAKFDLQSLDDKFEGAVYFVQKVITHPTLVSAEEILQYEITVQVLAVRKEKGYELSKVLTPTLFSSETIKVLPLSHDKEESYEVIGFTAQQPKQN